MKFDTWVLPTFDGVRFSRNADPFGPDVTTTEPPHPSTPPLAAGHPGRTRQLLRWALLAVALLLLGVTGTATLAGFFGRNHWLLDLLCHFRVQYFWLLAAAAGMILFLHRWVLGAIAVALASVNLALVVPLYFGSHSLTGVPPSLRILSINVHFLNRDFQPTLDLIAEEQPDVVYLMEITPEWAEALKPIEVDYPYSKVMPSHKPDGVALYSRHPFVDLEVKRCPGINLPTLITGIAMPAGQVTLVATHPASPGSAKLAEARNIQLAMVADWSTERSGPVVLIGDLNTTSWSPYFQDLLRESRLRDSRYGFGVEPTWPWFPLPLRIPIDHCLVSPHFGVSNRRIGPVVGSDHRPLIVDLIY